MKPLSNIVLQKAFTHLQADNCQHLGSTRSFESVPENICSRTLPYLVCQGISCHSSTQVRGNKPRLAHEILPIRKKYFVDFVSNFRAGKHDYFLVKELCSTTGLLIEDAHSNRECS